MTSDTFMDLPSYLENIEHSIKNNFTLKSNEIDDVLIENIKFGPISNQTNISISKPKNQTLVKILSKNILLKMRLYQQKKLSLFLRTLTYAFK